MRAPMPKTDQDRDRDGRFTPKFSDDELLSAVRAYEPAGTSEIADEFDVTRPAVDQRLRKLRAQGLVTSKKIGQSLVWFAAERRLSSRDLEQATLGNGDRAITSPTRSGEPSCESPDEDVMLAVLDRVHIPEPNVDEKREAIRAAIEYLQDRGEARKQDFVRDVMTEHPAGYDDEAALEKVHARDSRYRGAWWRRVVKPALNEHPHADKPSSGGGVSWRWVGP